VLDVPKSRIEIEYDPNADADIEAIIGPDWAGVKP
jgi:hypothetical protein